MQSRSGKIKFSTCREKIRSGVHRLRVCRAGRFQPRGWISLSSQGFRLAMREAGEFDHVPSLDSADMNWNPAPAEGVGDDLQPPAPCCESSAEDAPLSNIPASL